MGAAFYYQSTSVYFSEDKIGSSVDNTTSDPVKGTTMEHHFDEAFGYSGLPIDYPSNTANLAFWAKYINGRNSVLENGTKIMSAFLQGRAAISNADYAKKDEAIQEIRRQWELAVVGSAIHYLNGAKADLADNALRNHQLSEAWAFIWSLQFNSEKTISSESITTVLNILGENFYEVTPSAIDEAITILATQFNLTDVANTL